MTGVHRDQIDAVIRDYGTTPRWELPEWLKSPEGEQGFSLGMSLFLFTECPETNPIYDDDGFLTGWKGIGLKEQAN